MNEREQPTYPPDTPDVLAARASLAMWGIAWLSAPSQWLAAARVLAPIARPVTRIRLWPSPREALSRVRSEVGNPVVFVLGGLAALPPADVLTALTEISDLRSALAPATAWLVIRSELPMHYVIARAERDSDEPYLYAGERLPPELVMQRVPPGILPPELEEPLAGHPGLVQRAIEELRNGVPVEALSKTIVDLARPIAEAAVSSLRSLTPTALEAIDLDPHSLSDDERDALMRWDLLRSGVFEGSQAPLRPGPPALLEAVRRLR